MKKFLIVFIILLVLFSYSLNVYAAPATPTIVNKINNALKSIKEWIIKIATPAAAVSVCTGALIRKFSFGDEERISTGKKLIRNALFSYFFIISIDLILKAIDSFI